MKVIFDDDSLLRATATKGWLKKSYARVWRHGLGTQWYYESDSIKVSYSIDRSLDRAAKRERKRREKLKELNYWTPTVELPKARLLP